MVTLKFVLNASLIAVSTMAQAGPPAATVDAILLSAHFQGVVMAADASGVFYRTVIGQADRLKQVPLNADTIWRWASVTKQVTAVLVMQQVDAGRLTLDMTLAQALPLFKTAQAQHITIRQLLQHTSGLPNPDDSPTGVDGVPGFYGEADRAVAENWCSGPAKHAPGEQFEYNNCDYLLLGRILERLDGRSYAQLVQARIARPLGLNTLTVVSAQGKPRSPVVGYQVDGVPEARFSLAIFGAAGAIEGSPADMLSFDRALLDGKLMSATRRETMWTGDPNLGYVGLGAWAFPAKLKGCDGATRLVERRGEIGAVQVRNFIARDAGIAVVMLSNDAATNFGEVWRGQGLSHDVLAAIICGR